MRALIAAILVIVIGGAIAAGAYDAGLAQGAAQLAAPAGAVVPAVAYYGPHWGYGFFPFGFLFPILGLFLFFGLGRPSPSAARSARRTARPHAVFRGARSIGSLR